MKAVYNQFKLSTVIKQNQRKKRALVVLGVLEKAVETFACWFVFPAQHFSFSQTFPRVSSSKQLDYELEISI